MQPTSLSIESNDLHTFHQRRRERWKANRLDATPKIAILDTAIIKLINIVRPQRQLHSWQPKLVCFFFCHENSLQFTINLLKNAVNVSAFLQKSYDVWFHRLKGYRKLKIALTSINS
ncbi:hypothetical protein BC943DRAFT_212044 [Umbelopsis sp. AD052]|nr:hypothetical protein BC943DRAFT_212044 [Umbelopsis sp. AD052]